MFFSFSPASSFVSADESEIVSNACHTIADTAVALEFAEIRVVCPGRFGKEDTEKVATMNSSTRSLSALTRCIPRRFLATTTARRKAPPRRKRQRPKEDSAANFGIEMPDYQNVPPIMPTPFAPPPRPGTKAFLLRMVWPLMLVSVASLGLFVYLNEDEDNTEFWRTVESGGAILADGDDDDDDDDYLEDEDNK